MAINMPEKYQQLLALLLLKEGKQAQDQTQVWSEFFLLALTSLGIYISYIIVGIK